MTLTRRRARGHSKWQAVTPLAEMFASATWALRSRRRTFKSKRMHIFTRIPLGEQVDSSLETHFGRASSFCLSLLSEYVNEKSNNYFGVRQKCVKQKRNTRQTLWFSAAWTIQLHGTPSLRVPRSMCAYEASTRRRSVAYSKHQLAFIPISRNE